MSIKDGYLVFLHTRLYGGSKKLKPEDIGLDESRLPPRQLAELGRKHLLDPKDLSRLYSKAKSVRYILEQKAVRVEGAYFLPKSIAKEVMDEVDSAIAEAREEITRFLDSYEEKAKAWREMNPEWSSILDDLPTRSQLKKRMRVKRTAVKIGDIEGGEEELAGSLVSALVSQIRVVGGHLQEMCGNPVLRGRSLLPLRRLQSKLEAYGFLSPEVNQLAFDLKEILAGKNHDLSDDEKQGLSYAASILARKDVLECVRQAMLENRNALVPVEAPENENPAPEPEEAQTKEDRRGHLRPVSAFF